MSQQQLKKVLGEIIALHLPIESFEWLTEKAHSAAQFNSAFAATPRKTGKSIVALSADQEKNIAVARKGFIISGWSIDRLSRVWLLMHLDATDKDRYIKTIEALFPAAAVAEQVALYSALPVLEYPESWAARCSEGIRSNIGDVLLAIMCNNPYPAEQLDEPAWNQLVLKAFFTEKPIHEITGIDNRSNPKLASTLSDYAHERWAAHRSVNPQLWRCIGRFLNQQLFADIERLAASPHEWEREAAALACSDSSYPPAASLLATNSPYASAIRSGTLTWRSLAEKMSSYVLQP